MNVTSTHVSTTAVSYSVATFSSESSANMMKTPITQRPLFPKCDYGHKISMKHAFSLALSRSGIHKSILKGWWFWENWWVI